MFKLLRTGVIGRNRPLSPNLRTTAPPGASSRNAWRTGVLAAALGLLSGGSAMAQASAYTFSQPAAVTYTEITGATISSSGSGMDDATFAIAPAGFSFVYNGATYTQFYISENGYISFGNVNPTGSTRSALSTSFTGQNGVASPFSRDLAGTGATSSLSYVVTGSGSSQVLTVQWKAMANFLGTQNLNFQVVLSEVDNSIEFVYGTMSAPTSTTGQVGIRTLTTDFNNRTTATAGWATSAAGGTNSATMAVSTTIAPTSGVVFRFVAPTCFAPTAVSAAPAITTAAISYTIPTSGTPVGYQYQYRDSPSGTLSGWLPVAGNPFTITSLTANTAYDVQVRTNCGSGDFSAATPFVTFTTLCTPVGAPISETFEATTGTLLPSCWNRIVVGTGSVGTTASTALNGSRLVQLVTSFTANASNRNVLILPPLNDLGGLPRQLRFRARITSGTGSVLVGTINGVGPAAVFTPIQLAIPLSTTAQDLVVNFDSYAGSDQFVAIKPANETSGSGTTFQLDNINWEVTPACPNPSALQTTSVGSTSANISFIRNISNSNVEVLWGDATYAPVTGAPGEPGYVGSQTGVTGSTYTITGLSGLTAYRVYVRSNCGGSGTSIFTGPISFTTLPAPLNVNVIRTANAGFTSIVGQSGTQSAIFSGTLPGDFSSADDQVSAAITIPFTVDFLGTNFTTIRMSTNGNAQFNTTSTAFTNVLGSLPQSLAPFYEDLDRNIDTKGDIEAHHLYRITGTSPNRVLTLEWNDTRRFANTGSSLTFQIKIYENATNTNNKIEYWYGPMTAYNGTTIAPAYSYSLGLVGTGSTQLVAQQVENTNYFQNTAQDLLAITPSCDTKYEFIQGTPYTGTAPVAATAPSNDQLCNAASLTINNVSAPATQYCTYYTTALATPTAPTLASCAGTNADDDVWFTVTTGASASTNLQLRVGASNGFTPSIQVFTSSNGLCSGTLTQVGTCVTGSTAGGVALQGINPAPANTTYFIRVSNVGTGSGSGQFVIDAFGLPLPPANDECASAVALGSTVADCPAVPVSGTVFAATSSGNTGITGTCNTTAPGNDVWYTFVGASNGATVAVTGSATMVPEIEVFSGASCGALTSLGCAAATVGGGTASLTLSVTNGTTYRVRVHSTSSTGSFTICATTVTFLGNDNPTTTGAGTAYDLTPGVTCVTTNGTTVGALGPYNTTTNWFTSPDDDVYYSFQATTVATNITVVPTSPTFPTVIEAFNGLPAPGAVVERDDISGAAGASTTLELTGLTIGTRYYFRVFSSGTTERSAFTVCVREIVPPANDEPAAALVSPYTLTASAGCVTTLGTTLGATTTTGTGLSPAPTFSGGIASPLDVWYTFTTTGTVNRAITVEPTATNNTTFDPAIQVLTFDSGTSTYTEVDNVDDANPSFPESLTLTGLAAGTYYVRVYNTQDFGTTNGDFNICLTTGNKSLSGQPNVLQGPTTTVGAGTNNNHILTVEVSVTGATGTLPVTNMTFRSTNISNADVKTSGAKLYFSADNVFTPGVDALVGTATINGSGDIIFVNPVADMPIGFSYFFLSYDIATTATAGNTVDAQVQANNFTIGGFTYPSTLRNPTGSRTITPAPPAFDAICGSITLPVAAINAPVVYQEFNNQFATTDLPVPSCQASYGKDVWFRVNVPASRNLYIDVLAGLVGTAATDQILDVFSTPTGSCVGTLTALTCNDDGSASTSSLEPSLSLTGIAAGINIVYVRVSSFGGAPTGGSFRIAVADRPKFTGGSSTAFVPTTVANFFPQSDALSTILSSTTVTIPTGLTADMASSQSFFGVAIAPGATLNINGTSVLTVGNGSLTNQGTLNQSATSGVYAAGTASVSLSAMTFENLRVGPNGASLAGAVNVNRVLRLEGNLVTNGRVLRLVSNANNTAMVWHDGGNVTGNTTVQRYIDPTISVTSPTYRHMSAPVVTTIGDLQVNTLPSYQVQVNPTWNADTTARPFPNIFEYDQSRVISARPRFSDGYASPNATSVPMEAGKGYSVYIADNVHPDFVGALNSGTVAQTGLGYGSLLNSGWHLLGNPYPSPMDWDLVTAGQRPGMEASISVLQSTGPNSANYVTRNGAGVGTLTNGVLAMAQGYFIRTFAPGTPGSVTLDNSVRPTTYVSPAHYRQANDTRTLVRLSLVQSGKQTIEGDETIVYFDETATNGRDIEHDASKMMSTGETPSLFTKLGGMDLAINGLGSLTSAETIVPMGVAVGVSGTYKLNTVEMLNIPAGTVVVLRDAVTGTDFDLTQNPTYTFTMDRNFRGQRFSLVFNPAGRVTGLTTLAAGQLSVFPNPVANNAELQVRMTALNANVKAVNARLVDALGRVVATEVMPVSGGNVDGAINTRTLSKGVYTLQLTAGQQTATRRVVIQ